MPTKRFLVFRFDSRDERGGWNDLFGSYDTLEEAQQVAASICEQSECQQIVDLIVGDVVFEMYLGEDNMPWRIKSRSSV